MAGYTRQSIADIINGSEVTAPPLNAEFNQMAAAFNGATGHSHDGSTGNSPKINLATSVSGYLPAVNGGFGGKNNFAATTNPLATDDAGDGYAPGSMWENTTTGRVFICVGNTSNAAVWRELVQVQTANKIIPEATDTVDLGEPSTRFQDLWLSGGLSAFGNGSLGGTLTVTGATTLSSTLAVTDTSTFTGTVTSNAINATTVAASGGFTGALTGNVTGDLTGNVTGNVTGDLTGDVTGDITSSGTSTFNNLDATGTTTITSGDINSGAMDGTTIGASTPAAGTFTNLTANTSLTAATADINGGTVDNATIGATTPSTGAFTTISTSGQATLASADINGGSIDGTTIGATSHTSGKFSTLQSTGNATLATADINGGTIDGTSIGSTTASSGAFTTVSATGGITGDLTGDVTGNVTGNVTGAITGNVTGNLTGNVTSAGTSTFNNVTIDGTLNMNAGTTATITNLSAPTNDNDAARKVDVDNAVANLVDSAPGTLDTLNELAAALGDDADFSTTITNSIATKLPLAGGTMTGAIAMSTNKITGVGDPTAAQDVSSKAYTDQQDALQVTKSGDSMSGNLAMGSNNITGLATPTANDHAVNKSYADNILGSSTAAATSASNAATSESNAATSETNAATSATSAANDLASVQSIYDQFDDRYLGSKSAAPTLDNDGNALLIGSLYFNTTTNLMYVYSSSGWVTAGSAVNGTTDRVTYTATAGQTVFAATYDAGYVDVYLNGVKLLAGTDFTATSGTNITLAAGAAVNDVVDIVGYGTFTLADHYTKTEADNRFVNATGDTLTGTLTFAAGQTFDGRDVSADGTKLDGIEANADVTDTANVTAAGALMDSELTDITAVKALDQGVATTDKPTFNGINSTEALPTVRPSLLLDFANSKTLDPRITFTRGSTATYWDGNTTAKAEENLVISSDDLGAGGGGGWSGSNVSLTADAATAPDGTTTATGIDVTTTANTFHFTGSTGSGQPSLAGAVTFSVFCKANDVDYAYVCVRTDSGSKRRSVAYDLSGSGAIADIFDQGGPVGASQTITSVGNGWYRCTITITNTSGTVLPFVGPHNDATLADINGSYAGVVGEGIYTWGAQLEYRDSATAYTATTSSPIVKYQPTLQTASSGEARFDHDPVTGESKGLLIEEARTNILTESQNIGLAGGWAYNQFNIYQNYAIAPDGTKTAHLFSPDTTPTTHYIRHNFSSTTGTFSVYAKAGGTNTFMFLIGSSVNEGLKVNLDTGTVISTNGGVTNYGVEYVGNGWYRCWAYAPSASTAAYMYVPDSGGTQTGDGFNGVYLWGAQFEAGSFPTSYIPTSGSTVTRSRDEPNVIDLSWLNNQEGSFSMEGATLPSLSTTGFYTWWSIEGDTSGNENRLIFYNNNRLYYQSAASTYSAVGSVPRDGTFFKTSGSFKYGDSVLAPASFDGVSAEYTGANGPTALQPNILRIGRSRSNLYPVSGHIKKLSFFTKQLNQTTLNAMTEE